MEYKEREDNPLHRKFGIWSNTGYILRQIVHYRPSIIPVMLAGIISESVLSYYWGIVGKYVIDLAQGGAAVEANMDALLRLLLVAGAVAVILTFVRTYHTSKTWNRCIYVRMQLITKRVDKDLRLNYDMLERPDVLDIHERATQATGGNDNGVEGMMHLMAALGKNIFTVAVTFSAVLVLNKLLIFVLIAIGILQYMHYRRIIKEDKAEVWDKLAPVWRRIDYMSRITQDFGYAKDIRLFNLSGFLSKKQQETYAIQEDRIDYSKELWFKQAVVNDGLYLVGNALIYGVMFYAVLKQGLTIGSFTMYLAFANAFSNSLMDFLHRFGDYERASLEVDDFRTFMEFNVEKEEEEAGGAVPVPLAEEYEIEFHDVCYRYLKQEKNAVDHLNLTLHPGEKLAVVGLNGAGKTTMIKLLLRLYDPTEGYITLNGVDIRKFGREEYYKLFSPVFQDIEVFAFPIAENISMRPPAKTDKARAEAAAIEAGLGDKLRSLEKGIDSELLKVVDDEGIDLSGGEKQKLALARALYKSAPIVVLDEPTSALDAIAEQQLYERFNHMIGTKSAVYISHRLASTRFCDKVAMFMGGRMVEYGSHDELISLGGEYAGMFEKQAVYYQEGVGEVRLNG